MNPWHKAATVALLVGMATGADATPAADEFFKRCMQFEAAKDYERLADRLMNAPAEARTSYRFHFYRMVVLYERDQPTEARERADLTMRAVVAEGDPKTIKQMERLVQAWANYWEDKSRIKMEEEYRPVRYYSGGGHTGYGLSLDEGSKETRDLFSVAAKEPSSPPKDWDWYAEVMSSPTTRTPEGFNAYLRDTQGSNVEAQPTPPAAEELPADNPTSSSSSSPASQ